MTRSPRYNNWSLEVIQDVDLTIISWRDTSEGVRKVERTYCNSISSIEDIDMSDILPSKFNPRSGTNIVTELADSIGRNGILHPITVRICENGFEIVAGNRRYHACKSLGWRKIPCKVTDLDDKEAFEISIIENVQRKTLDPVEEANAFKKYVVDYGWGGVSDLAEKLSKSPSYISKRIKLTELPVEVLELISESSLSVTAAEELLYVQNGFEQSNLAAVVSRRNISTRTVRKIVRRRREMDLGKLESDFYNNIESGNGFDRSYRITSVMDKSIVVLKTAVNNMADLIEGLEDNWLFYDILMQHKNMINSQIDLLIRQKRKYKRLMSRRYLV